MSKLKVVSAIVGVTVIPYIDPTDVALYPKVIVNRILVINCPASGIPTPDIVWAKDDEILDPTLHPNIQVIASGRQLRISAAAISDSGSYRCIATNKAGEDSLEYQLSVYCKLIVIVIVKSKFIEYWC